MYIRCFCKNYGVTVRYILGVYNGMTAIMAWLPDGITAM